MRSSKSISPPSFGGGPEAGGGNDDRGTGGRSKLSVPGRVGGLTTPCWGAVGCRNTILGGGGGLDPQAQVYTMLNNL